MAERSVARRPYGRDAPARPVALVSSLCAGLLLVVLGAAPAHAQGYRYWSFWERDGDAWTYATQGPSTARPDDGETIGFRFAVSEDSRNAAQPRGAADFDAICAGTPAKGDAKRVAVVIDFGTAAHAPDGETPPPARTACARVRSGASAAEALAAVAKPLRYGSSALLCGIADYPRSGCAEQADRSGTGSGADSGDESATGTARPGRSGERADGEDNGGEGPSTGLLGGAAAVVALGAAAWWQTRRRRG
ncbi:SCO2322 family protein [Streptomyces sp. XD-27]|uniref:SCO2322 family protein n=1 Tax=Streptomyces sp. XD-27 TaxID=3062779 RepID=UPI0026F46812|nr:SCO2322 family protein [Streptomyces sp. XD-27]WKX70089.1 SCO2322 family protein [Streptomyces sp. XD-27]